MKKISRLSLVITVQLTLSCFMIPKTFADGINGQELFEKHCIVCHGGEGRVNSIYE
ncbi:MAG: c-type cytochrome [Planctomycetes bacterium]|nr:c-type cytochrome [Planctomycetota bacterium]